MAIIECIVCDYKIYTKLETNNFKQASDRVVRLWNKSIREKTYVRKSFGWTKDLCSKSKNGVFEYDKY